MALLSDTALISAIKAAISGNGSLHDATGATATEAHAIYTEAIKGANEKNYVMILAPEAGTVTINEEHKQGGGVHAFNRPFIIMAFFKQIEHENNTRLYDWVKNFRALIDADPTLGTAGIEKASEVTNWGYGINPRDQTIQDFAQIELNIITVEAI